VDLFEHQARDLFAEHGVPVLAGVVATTAAQARAAAERLLGAGSPLVVAKAQVKTGGRGKAGGVRLARSAEEAEQAAGQILGMDIKGHTVRRVLVAAGADVAAEHYVSLLLDRAERRCLAMCSVEGGMDIERLAVERPEALVKVPVDPRVGIDEAKAVQIVAAAGFDAETGAKIVPVLMRLWEVYRDEDATLVEVNPLVTTTDGAILALDGKVTLDDNAAFRHPGREALADTDAADPREARAKAQGLSYVRLSGEVGIIGNGAGLVMSTLDVVAAAGERHGGVSPANFFDIGGGASAEVMAAGLEIVLGDPRVVCGFVNVFGGITACDEVAHGIVAALGVLGDQATKPLVVRLDGNAVDEGRRILREAALPMVTLAETMDGGAEQAAALAGAARGLTGAARTLSGAAGEGA